jgi:hypothetical protein
MAKMPSIIGVGIFKTKANMNPPSRQRSAHQTAF